MRQLKFFLLLLFVPSLLAAASHGKLILNANFDDANLAGWRTAGDLCVAPAFCAGAPAGKYWVAMSTNSGERDSMTLCGASSLGGVQSVLRSPELSLPFKTWAIRIDFKVKFLTNENTSSDLGNDNLTVRLVTTAGPVVISSFDDSGASPESRNLSIKGDTSFHESECAQNWRYETGLLQVSYYRVFREPFVSRMSAGAVALEFALDNQYDQDFDSAVVIDDVQLRVYP